MNAYGSRRQPLFAELPAANSRHVRSVAFGDKGAISGRVPRVSTEMPMPHPVSSGLEADIALWAESRPVVRLRGTAEKSAQLRRF